MCCDKEMNLNEYMKQLPSSHCAYKQYAVLIHNQEYLKKQVSELKEWVNDLQSGMYINCVYCGHRYGPNTEISASMADVLKEHIGQCPKHPMSVLKKKIDVYQKFTEKVLAALQKMEPEFSAILNDL